jgi:hypothetical protein
MIQYVYKLNEQQKDQLINSLVMYDWYFNPVQDGNGDWIISTEEVDNSIYPENMWVKDLPLIEWIPPVVEPLLNIL